MQICFRDFQGLPPTSAGEAMWPWLSRAQVQLLLARDLDIVPVMLVLQAHRKQGSQGNGSFHRDFKHRPGRPGGVWQIRVPTRSCQEGCESDTTAAMETQEGRDVRNGAGTV
jgi:hypothetical protein